MTLDDHFRQYQRSVHTPSLRKFVHDKDKLCNFSHVLPSLFQEELIDNIPGALDNKFYFVPNTTFYVDLMEKFRRSYDIVDERVIGFPTETDIWNKIEDLASKSFIIVFNGSAPEHHLQYTIRSKSNQFKTDQQYSRNLPEVATRNSNEYISEGFIGIQHAIDSTFFGTVTGGRSVYRIEMERFPAPPELPKSSKIHDLGIYFIIFSAFICISLVFTRVVEEKACGFREQLKNATRFSFLNNVALFSVNLLQMLLLFYIILAVTYFDRFWFSVNVVYAVLLIALFLSSIISFTFLVSAFFESSEFLKH